MRAAQYVRMSTEHQQYSIPYQLAAIEEYATFHGFQIVRTYTDEAKSGIDLKGRPGLRKLLDDVMACSVDFQTILVYDVSRWDASRTQTRPHTGSSFASRLESR